MILCKRKFFFLLFPVLFQGLTSFGQDAHFSQFYANPLYLNPAFTGTVNCPRFAINFRDQYPAIPRNYMAFSGSYDQHINALHGGIGALFSADIAGAGIMQTYSAGIIYNYRLHVSHQFNLQFAMQTNFLHTSLNWQNFEFASEIIPVYISETLPTDYYKSSNSQIDGALGFVGYTSHLYFGLAVHHLFPVQMGFRMLNIPKYMLGIKWTAHIGGEIPISKKLKDEDNYGDISLYPNVLFTSQKQFHYLHEGFYFKFYPFTIGTWIRHTFKNLDAIIVSCGVEYKILRIGYSYDFTVSKLERTGGAHEVSLQFVIPCKNDNMQHPSRKSINASRLSSVACPRF